MGTRGEYSVRGRRPEVVAGVLLGLKGVDELEEWPSHLAWSNLCKLAPAAGRNPSTGLWNAQLSSCIGLLKYEIDVLRPKRILFLCGLGWVEPIQLDFADKRSHQTYVELSGRLTIRDGHTADVVVSKHPESKPDRLVIADILTAFADLGR